jgi:two-component system response regulator
MKPLQILMVEDNEDDRLLNMRVLRKLPINCTVEIARNGAEALEWLLETSGQSDRPLPEVILLDLQMPKIDGIHMLAHLRTALPHLSVPILILSSSDNPIDLASCQGLGVSGYLSKPLDPRLLLEHFQTLGLI